jgi:beta-N-acetylhexosaminidase
VLVGCTGTSSTQVEVRAEPEPVESTTTTTPPDCAELLPPAAQAGQLLMVMVTSPQLAGDALAAGTVGGFGLKGRQSADVGEQVTEAIDGAPVPPFVASDEEGGTVQRLALAIDELPSASELAEGTPSEAGALFGEYATSMAALGFNMNFGPVVDVGSGSDLGTRSFGDDASTVASFTDVIISAQEDAGIASIVKHWPGIGGGSTDPHLALADGEPIEDLRAEDLVAFDRAFAAGASGVMVAHVVIPGLTAEDEPASLSRAAITDELRGRQGFDGLVVTDSLGMGAIVETTSQDEAAELAVLAGADIALVSGADVVDEAHARLTEAITEERIPTDQVVASVRRVLAAKGIEGPCVDVVAAYSSRLQANADAEGTDGGSTESGTASGTGTGSSAVTDSGINDDGTSGSTSSGSSAGSSSSSSGRSTSTTSSTGSGSSSSGSSSSGSSSSGGG